MVNDQTLYQQRSCVVDWYLSRNIYGRYRWVCSCRRDSKCYVLACVNQGDVIGLSSNTPIYTYGIGSAYGGDNTDYVACANMGTISTGLSNNTSGELMRGATGYGVWKAGMLYSVDTEGLYTVIWGVINHEKAVAAMNKAIVDWNLNESTKNPTDPVQCEYEWINDGDWPILVTQE